MKKTILRWELVGIIVISLVGALLHFLFEWTNYWPTVALIAAVNESVWEHCKIGFWPALFFALVEYPFIKNSTNNFLVAKSAGLVSIPIVIISSFYGYTAVTRDHYFPVDISIFILSIAVGQFVSYKILTTDKMPSARHRLAAAGLAMMIAAFSLLSYFPARIALFEHHQSKQYGILASYDNHE